MRGRNLAHQPARPPSPQRQPAAAPAVARPPRLAPRQRRKASRFCFKRCRNVRVLAAISRRRSRLSSGVSAALDNLFQPQPPVEHVLKAAVIARRNVIGRQHPLAKTPPRKVDPPRGGQFLPPRQQGDVAHLALR